jgi:signal transduction histidine kinase
MRKLFLIIFCLTALADVKLKAGDHEKADSLLRKLKSLEGIERMHALNGVAELLMHDSPDSALKFANEALGLAKSNQELEGEAYATSLIGSISYLKGNLDEALNLHRDALAIRLGLTNKRALADSYNDIGALHDRAGREDSALNYYQYALNIFIEIDDLQGISQSYNNIGVFYWRTNDTPKAIQMFERSEKIDLQLGNDDDLSYTYSNLGACHGHLGELKKSLEYHRKALEIRTKLGNQLQVSRSLNNIATAYSGLKDYQNAISYFQQALEIKRQLGHSFEVLETLNNLALAFIGAKDLGRAMETTQEAVALSDSLEAPRQKVDALTCLATIYELKGDYRSAFETLMDKTQLRDSLQTVEKNTQLAEMQAKFEAAQQRMKIDQLNLEKDKAEIEVSRVQSRNSILVAVILIVLVIAVFFYSLATLRAKSNRELSHLNHQLEHSNHEIAAKNEEIERQKGLLEVQNQQIRDINLQLEQLVEVRTADLRQANEELDTFLYQSSHAMRAPILRLQGLFELAEVEKDPVIHAELIKSIDITLNRIDGMLRKLNQVSGLARRDVRPAPIDLEHTVEESLAQMAHLTPDERASVKIDLLKSGQLFTDPGLLRIILANLLENAYQFRAADVVQPKVEIELVPNETETILYFRDFGQGIPYPIQSKVFGMFVRGTESSKGEGLGLYVVKKAVEKLGAAITLTSAPGRTEIKISFPKDRPTA